MVVGGHSTSYVNSETIEHSGEWIQMCENEEAFALDSPG